MIPFIDLAAQQARIRDKIEAGFGKVLDHGSYVMGPEVGAIETRLAEAAGTRHCISCSSGTDALILALLAHGLSPGQGVIVPSFTFAASAEVKPVLGAVPVFAEVDPVTFNLDPASLPAAMAAARESGIEPVGIIGVGLFGQPADYAAIGAFAEAEVLPRHEANSDLFADQRRLYNEDGRFSDELLQLIGEAVSYTHLTLPTICSV